MALRFVIVANIESLVSAKGWQRVEIDEKRRLVRGTWRGEEVVMVAEAVSARWNKVTFGRLVDR